MCPQTHENQVHILDKHPKTHNLNLILNRFVLVVQFSKKCTKQKILTKMLFKSQLEISALQAVIPSPSVAFLRSPSSAPIFQLTLNCTPATHQQQVQVMAFSGQFACFCSLPGFGAHHLEAIHRRVLPQNH